MKKMRSKQLFAVLEILIATGILALCAMPLVCQPLFAAKNTIKDAWKSELYRQAEVEWQEIKIALHRGKVPLSGLAKNMKSPYVLMSKTIPMSLDTAVSKSFTFTPSIRILKQKTLVDGRTALLLEVKIQCTEDVDLPLRSPIHLSFTYHICTKSEIHLTL